MHFGAGGSCRPSVGQAGWSEEEKHLLVLAEPAAGALGSVSPRHASAPAPPRLGCSSRGSSAAAGDGQSREPQFSSFLARSASSWPPGTLPTARFLPLVPFHAAFHPQLWGFADIFGRVSYNLRPKPARVQMHIHFKMLIVVYELIRGNPGASGQSKVLASLVNVPVLQTEHYRRGSRTSRAGICLLIKNAL